MSNEDMEGGGITVTSYSQDHSSSISQCWKTGEDSLPQDSSIVLSALTYTFTVYHYVTVTTFETDGYYTGRVFSEPEAPAVRCTLVVSQLW